ncbi:hypothetical protein [Sphingomonas profundi]|uniref:hypothetical protein n=1 Tax=Alterirhizorhabdus profundi TaxID=2681549 RepID=UPI0012E725A6|nr:hypothetical protein [Sphingomonas profundi]
MRQGLRRAGGAAYAGVMAEDRERRLAEALRANLRRRKDQARAASLDAESGTEGAPADPPPPPFHVTGKR